MLGSQLSSNWKEYATVKQWKKNLKINSNSNRLSKSTEESIDLYMPLFLEFKQKTPDEIIEESLAGKYVVRESLSDFHTWLQDEKGKKYNHANQISYNIIRGFYSHNDIPTQKIRAPKPEPSQVQFDDDLVPLTEIKTVEENGKQIKKKLIRRDFLKLFFEVLSHRDKIIAMCIMNSGLDSGDLLSLPLSVIRSQDPKEERIFIRITRKKTKELVSTFLTKETTKLVRNYEKMSRSEAMNDEPIFVQSMQEFKSEFSKKHERPFMKNMDDMILNPIRPKILSMNFRNATQRLEKQLSQKLLFANKQSPLRPKRFRKLFSDICEECGISTDIKRIFMGKSDSANKPYDGKARQDLEIFYEKMEESLTVYSEPQNESDFLEIKRLRDELEQTKQNQKSEIQKVRDDIMKEVSDKLEFFIKDNK